MKTASLVFLLALPVVLAGCGTRLSFTDQNVVHTLAGNPRLPSADIRRFCGEEEWRRLKDRPYDGYVVVRAQINPDGTVSGLRVRHSHPDARWNKMALEWCSDIQVRRNNVASRVNPSAEIFVLFYATWHEAFIFGRQSGAVGSTTSAGGDHFLFIRGF